MLCYIFLKVIIINKKTSP